MGQNRFKLAQKVEDGVNWVTMEGPLDEQADIPDIRREPKIVFNLQKVTALNSVGTRQWCLWMQKLKPPIQVELQGCPVIFVKSFSIVKGFLPENASVVSFFIPFYSPDTGERRDFLVERGTHFNAKSGEIRLPEIRDSKGELMELDIIENSYLSFLVL